MPRTLPWLQGQESNGRSPRDSTPQRRKRESPEVKVQPKEEDDEKTPRPDSGDLKKRDFFKSSQSPPTSPIQRCPSEEYLIEGFDNDDIYMMVEDEFYAVAQTFTQHLHYAEYVRRSKEAKLQNAAAIQDIARPTDGATPMSEETRKKKAAEELSARQRAGLERVENKRPRVDSGDEKDDELEDDAEDDSWAGTCLYGLLTSPRKTRSLVGMQGIKSTTRAAAGYAQIAGSGRDRVTSDGNALSSPSGGRGERQHQLVEETASTASTASEDDDLELGSSTTSTRPLKRTAAALERNTPIPGTSSSMPNSTRIQTAEKESFIARRNGAQPPSRAGFRRTMLFDDLDENPEPNRSNTLIQSRERSTPLGRTPQDGPGDKGRDPKKSRLNEVPTFLF